MLFNSKLSEIIENKRKNFYVCVEIGNMTYNLTAYFIYLGATFFITIRVGYLCYSNGEVFIRQVIENERLTRLLNRILLTGYYLFNLGYLALSIRDWKNIEGALELWNILSERIGLIVLILAFMHYFNIVFIAIFGKKLLKL